MEDGRQGKKDINKNSPPRDNIGNFVKARTCKFTVIFYRSAEPGNKINVLGPLFKLVTPFVRVVDNRPYILVKKSIILRKGEEMN